MIKTSCVFWTVLAAAVPVATFADSLCGVTDEAVLETVLPGVWDLEGANSLETETLSVTEGFAGRFFVADDARFSAVMSEGLLPPVPVWIEADGMAFTLSDMRLDVDRVDDLLDTAETAWMADRLSMTPCGPEDLPQWSSTYDTEGLNGTYTAIGYFTDAILLLHEAEARGDWGLGFVTSAALLTPKVVEPSQ